MKFVIYFAALISVLGWQVKCDDDDGNQMFNFKFDRYFDDFANWLQNVTNWDELKNGFEAHLPKHLTGTLCRNTTETIKATIPKSKSEFEFKEHLAILNISSRSRSLFFPGDDVHFASPDFVTWMRTVKNRKDFENGFLSHLPKHVNLSSVAASFCTIQALNVIGVIKDKKLIDFVANPENWNVETYDGGDGVGLYLHQKIPDVMEEKLADTKKEEPERSKEARIILEAPRRTTRFQRQKL